MKRTLIVTAVLAGSLLLAGCDGEESTQQEEAVEQDVARSRGSGEGVFDRDDDRARRGGIRSAVPVAGDARTRRSPRRPSTGRSSRRATTRWC